MAHAQFFAAQLKTAEAASIKLPSSRCGRTGPDGQPQHAVAAGCLSGLPGHSSKPRGCRQSRPKLNAVGNCWLLMTRPGIFSPCGSGLGNLWILDWSAYVRKGVPFLTALAYLNWQDKTMVCRVFCCFAEVALFDFRDLLQIDKLIADRVRVLEDAGGAAAATPQAARGQSTASTSKTRPGSALLHRLGLDTAGLSSAFSLFCALLLQKDAGDDEVLALLKDWCRLAPLQRRAWLDRAIWAICPMRFWNDSDSEDALPRESSFSRWPTGLAVRSVLLVLLIGLGSHSSKNALAPAAPLLEAQGMSPLLYSLVAASPQLGAIVAPMLWGMAYTWSHRLVQLLVPLGDFFGQLVLAVGIAMVDSKTSLVASQVTLTCGLVIFSVARAGVGVVQHAAMARLLHGKSVALVGCAGLVGTGKTSLAQSASAEDVQLQEPAALRAPTLNSRCHRARLKAGLVYLWEAPTWELMLDPESLGGLGDGVALTHAQLRKHFAQGCDAVIFVMDCTRRQTVDEVLAHWLHVARYHCAEEAPFLFIGAMGDNFEARSARPLGGSEAAALRLRLEKLELPAMVGDCREPSFASAALEELLRMVQHMGRPKTPLLAPLAPVKLPKALLGVAQPARPALSASPKPGSPGPSSPAATPATSVPKTPAPSAPSASKVAPGRGTGQAAKSAMSMAKADATPCWQIPGDELVRFNKRLDPEDERGGRNPAEYAKWKGMPVVAKRVARSDLLARFKHDEQGLRRLLSELHNSHCPHLAKFYGATCISEEKVSLVMESKRLESHRPWVPPRDLLFSWAISCSSALAYLAELNPAVAHGNVRPSNLLLCTNLELRLSPCGALSPVEHRHQAAVDAENLDSCLYSPPEAGSAPMPRLADVSQGLQMQQLIGKARLDRAVWGDQHGSKTQQKSAESPLTRPGRAKEWCACRQKQKHQAARSTQANYTGSGATVLTTEDPGGENIPEEPAAQCAKPVGNPSVFFRSQQG
eukprot:s2344_g6.t1